MEKRSAFLDRLREVIRVNQLSYRTETTYINWMYRYIVFFGKRHPKEMGGREIEVFLTSLAVERKVSASTQNQALNALVFLYKQVLKVPLDDFDFGMPLPERDYLWCLAGKKSSWFFQTLMGNLN